MTPTNTTTSTYLAKPTPEEFFDSLMETIEPDLTSENAPFLETRYAGESQEQRAKRIDRYKAALEVCNELISQLGDATKEYELAARAAILPAA